MEIIAQQKFIRTSPQKIREVIGALRHIKDPDVLVAYLAQSPRRAAGILAKVVGQALANARNSKQVGLPLRVREIQIGDGPRIRRWRAGSRGMARPILKKLSHIRVVLETQDQKEQQQAKVDNTTSQQEEQKTWDKK